MPLDGIPNPNDSGLIEGGQPAIHRIEGNCYYQGFMICQHGAIIQGRRLPEAYPPIHPASGELVACLIAGDAEHIAMPAVH